MSRNNWTAPHRRVSLPPFTKVLSISNAPYFLLLLLRGARRYCRCCLVREYWCLNCHLTTSWNARSKQNTQH